MKLFNASLIYSVPCRQFLSVIAHIQKLRWSRFNGWFFEIFSPVYQTNNLWRPTEGTS